MIKFDAPGDFQLAERADIHKIQGFNESMLRGWHVDSNLCKRLNFLHGFPTDLSHAVYGYHCGHNRLMTLKHRRDAVEDKFSEFVDMVAAPDLPQQAETWGLPHEEIEEIRLDRSPAFPGIVSELAGPPLEKPLREYYVEETYDHVTYEPAHMLAFIADLFMNVQRNASVAWIGRYAGMFNLFHRIRKSMGFTAPILVQESDAVLLSARGMDDVEVLGNIGGICARADMFAFDFVQPDGAADL